MEAEVKESPSVTEIVSEGSSRPSPLLYILHNLQDNVGYISEDAVRQISESLKIPMPEVISVITFHRQFKLQMSGMPEVARNTICVCSGAPCYTKGSQPIMDELCRLLRIEKGEITKDKKFSLDMVDCLGTCGTAPVMVINEDVYGKLTNEQLPAILEKYE